MVSCFVFRILGCRVYLQLILGLLSLGPLCIDSLHLLHQLDLTRFGIKIRDEGLGFQGLGHLLHQLDLMLVRPFNASLDLHSGLELSLDSVLANELGCRV